jgi:neutral ceramidase
LTVERNDTGSWTVVKVDGDWETIMRWERRGIAESLITIEWDITPDITPGIYRIRHFGATKSLTGKITPYEGSSSTFRVTS